MTHATEASNTTHWFTSSQFASCPARCRTKKKTKHNKRCFHSLFPLTFICLSLQTSINSPCFFQACDARKDLTSKTGGDVPGTDQYQSKRSMAWAQGKHGSGWFRGDSLAPHLQSINRLWWRISSTVQTVIVLHIMETSGGRFEVMHTQGTIKSAKIKQFWCNLSHDNQH